MTEINNLKKTLIGGSPPPHPQAENGWGGVHTINMFKSLTNPSCIYLFLTNFPSSFQNTRTIFTALSDFHKMVITVMKITFHKNPPKEIYYRDYKNFDQEIKQK